MQASTDRILTTFAGSLPRPPELVPLLWRGEATDDQLQDAVHAAVAQQAAAGIDVIGDGEQGKTGFNVYVRYRLTGFGEGPATPWVPQDLVDHPALLQRVMPPEGTAAIAPACVGEIQLRDPEAVHRDIDRFRKALEGVTNQEAFLTAASPGVLASTFADAYYASHEAYLAALAQVMRHEYLAITEAGFVLQVDSPDLAMDRHLAGFADQPLSAFRAHARQAIEALNTALEGIAPERVRLHVCWGNYPGTHERDVPLGDILDLLMQVRCGALLVVAANRQHQETTYRAVREWVEERGWPDGKLLIVGVIDPLSTVAEHRETVAAAIERYAELVGREHVLAGTDCGFATIAGVGEAVVPDSAVSGRLRVLADGAALASKRLWGQSAA